MNRLLVLALVSVSSLRPARRRRSRRRSRSRSGVRRGPDVRGLHRPQGYPMARAAKHTRECSFHPECASSGFGIFADGKFTKFDTEGSAKALKALQVSKREKGCITR